MNTNEERQKLILDLAAAEVPNAVIAERVGLTDRSVRSILASAMRCKRGYRKCRVCKTPTQIKRLTKEACLACRLRGGDVDRVDPERRVQAKIFDVMFRRGGVATVAIITAELQITASAAVAALSQSDWFVREAAGQWRIAKK